MAQPRPEELSTDHNIIDVVETSIVDLIQVNSGTCTGNFAINTISSNRITNSGPVITDHLMANSGTLSAKLISSSIQANSGVYLTSLTVSGLPVRIDSLGAGSGITAVVQDTSPTLGGDLNGNSKNITALASITANTGSFPVSMSAGSVSANSIGTAGSLTADQIVANSGSLTGKLTAGSGSFSTSLTISGASPVTSAVTALTVSGGTQKTGVVNFVGSRAANVSVANNTFTFDAVPGLTAVVQDTSPILGGNLNGNSKDIAALNSITANTGSFPVSMSAGSVSGNSVSSAGSVTADQLVANSGSLTGKLIATTAQVNTGTFSTSLTVSGLPVLVSKDNLRIDFNQTIPATWTNMPTAATFFNGSAGIVQQVDLSNKSQVRLQHTRGAVAGAASSTLYLRFSSSFSATATNYVGMTTAPNVGTPSVAVNGTNTFLDTGWQTLIPTAKNVVFLAVVGSGGDGALDPTFGSIVADFR